MINTLCGLFEDGQDHAPAKFALFMKLDDTEGLKFKVRS